MVKLSKQSYLDKMRGCWLGKAIGGTLGTPFEPTRGVFDVDFYTSDLENGMLPNDDLDLQLVWLNAAERYGCSVSAEKLSEYWILGIVPNWAEYGVGKSNLRLGINAPASGKFNNKYKDSNGAWIRSEIWACLAPGHPEIAVKYAYEDASVDHADEGVYSEIFMAALESAAFVENDRMKLIDIALSYIPSECECAKAVSKLLELYSSGIDWKQARLELLHTYPGSFGGQKYLLKAFGGSIGGESKLDEDDVPNANWGFDAPSNVALTLIGWLYAGDDFGKALCITTACGEDADCTAGSLGAILGIMMGANAIPEKWKAPIGNKIATACINNFTANIKTPATIDELVTRTANLMPAFVTKYVNIASDENELVSAFSGEELYSQPLLVINETNGTDKRYFRENIPTQCVFRGSSATLDVKITAPNGIEIAQGSDLSLDVLIENTTGYMGMPLYANIRWLMPEGISIVGGNEYSVFVNQHHCGLGRCRHTVILTVETAQKPLVNAVCEITVPGYPTKIYVPVSLVSIK